MRTIFAVIVSLISLPLAAQSALPPCAKDALSTWTNCVGSWADPDGNTYIGEYLDGSANGQGTFTWARGGSYYVGEFRNGQFSGEGTYKNPYGDVYVGGFSAGKSFGKGKLISSKGYPLVEGLWMDDDNVVVSNVLWHQLGRESDGAFSFVAPQTIRQEKQLRRAWFMRAMPAPESDKALSYRFLSEFDCKDDRNRTRSFSAFQGSFGTGQLLESTGESGWVYVAPGTAGDAMLRFVCDYKTTP
jgi:hypothetical protein